LKTGDSIRKKYKTRDCTAQKPCCTLKKEIDFDKMIKVSYPASGKKAGFIIGDTVKVQKVFPEGGLS